MIERVEILGQLYKICSSILIADATRQGSKYTRTLKAVELNHACPYGKYSAVEYKYEEWAVWSDFKLPSMRL